MPKSDLEKLADRELPIILVALDAGTFEWLHDMVRRRSEQHQWLEPYRALTHRALLQFEEAAGARDGVPTSGRKRVIPPPKPVAKRTRKR